MRPPTQEEDKEIKAVKKRTLRELSVSGKRVLVRVDYNVPMDGQGRITDDTRIRASLPTLRFLIESGSKVILASHLGRPNGKPDPAFSLRPVAQLLGGLLNKEVAFSPDCVGEKALRAAQALGPGEVLLLENLRYHPGEEKNDPAFAKELANLADVFIQDAFGAVHRGHASTEAVARELPSAAGFLLLKELEYLSKVRENPVRPYVAILGGAKVSDKISVLEALIEKVDALVIGGAMAYTFLLSQGTGVGSSRVEEDHLETAKRILDSARARPVEVILPQDHLVVDTIDSPRAREFTAGTAIPSGRIGVDIGPKTVAAVKKVLEPARTVFWNGPLGIFERPDYAAGTREVAQMLADLSLKGLTAVVGGGDSAAAIKSMNLEGKISHVSTGGGASLEFLEGRDLPGVSVLPNA